MPASRRPTLSEILGKRLRLSRPAPLARSRDVVRLPDDLVDVLRPAAQLDRLLGVRAGNHESRPCRFGASAQVLQEPPAAIVRRDEVVDDDLRLVLLDEAGEARFAAADGVDVCRDDDEAGVLERGNRSISTTSSLLLRTATVMRPGILLSYFASGPTHGSAPTSCRGCRLSLSSL